jgi:hypothetical protein
MKAKIFVLGDKQSKEAIKLAQKEAINFLQKEAMKFCPYRYIHGDDAYAIAKNKSKYGYYKNEVESHVKALILETSSDFPYSSFYNVDTVAGEKFNTIVVNRPLLEPLELNVTMFFLSYGYPNVERDPSFDARFDIVEFPF